MEKFCVWKVLPSKFLANQGISVHQIARGGDVTYHGDGQIVGYPIFNIKENKIGIRNFVEGMEQLFIDLLNNEFNINAAKDPGHTGVWIGNNKIVAIGLAVKHGVTMHGFAFNVNTNLFARFNKFIAGGEDRNPRAASNCNLTIPQ